MNTISLFRDRTRRSLSASGLAVAIGALGCADGATPLQPTGDLNTAAEASTSTQTTARAELDDIRDSDIEAVITFVESENTLTVTGTGRGFHRNKVYVSLVYDPGSVPTGPSACLPTPANQLSFTQMVLGYWLPFGSRDRTLSVVKTGASFAALNQIGTASVRRDRTPDQPLPSAPDPNRFRLKACGAVVADGD